MTKEELLKNPSFINFKHEEYKIFKAESGRYPSWKESQELDEVLYERFINEFKIKDLL